jgi:hypothetical protein
MERRPGGNIKGATTHKGFTARLQSRFMIPQERWLSKKPVTGWLIESGEMKNRVMEDKVEA